MDIVEYAFDRTESQAVAEIARALKRRLSTDPSASLPRTLAEYSVQLPESVTTSVASVSTSGALAAIFTFTSGNFEPTPPTPDRYIEKGTVANFTIFQLAQALVFWGLGEPVGYRYVRSGSLISNIIPISEHARASNVTSNYATSLDFHTEDAFHPFRADYLVLGCHRNDERIPTWLSAVAECEIDAGQWEILSQEDVQLQANKPRFDTSTYPAQRVLANTPADPILRLPVHRSFYHSPRANGALDELVIQLNDHKIAALLEPNQILVFDNSRVAHARDPYEARIGADGGARWLSRTLHLRDLGRAHAYRDPTVPNVLF